MPNNSAFSPEDMVRDMLLEALRLDEKVDMAVNPSLFGIANKRGMAIVRMADGTIISVTITKVQIINVPEPVDDLSS